jgi:type II secretory pathway pseudopilin PulG
MDAISNPKNVVSAASWGGARRVRGFALFEWLVAIALVEMVTAMVVPALQSDRSASSGAATGNPRQQINQITAYIDASSTYGKALPSFPDILVGAGLPADGTAAGYQLGAEIQPDGALVISADPVPGLTGNKACRITARFGAKAWEFGEVHCREIPDAARRQAALIQALLRAAGNAFSAHAGSMGLLPTGDQRLFFERLVFEATDPTSQSYQEAHRLLFFHGALSFATLAATLSTYRIENANVLEPYWRELEQKLMLGARRENWRALPAIDQLPTEASGPHLVSYYGLAQLTRELIDDPEVQRKMSTWVCAAASAESRGDTYSKAHFLTSYLAELESSAQIETGKFVQTDYDFKTPSTASDRQMLKALARAFLDATTPVPAGPWPTPQLHTSCSIPDLS